MMFNRSPMEAELVTDSGWKMRDPHCRLGHVYALTASTSSISAGWFCVVSASATMSKVNNRRNQRIIGSLWIFTDLSRAFFPETLLVHVSRNAPDARIVSTFSAERGMCTSFSASSSARSTAATAKEV